MQKERHFVDGRKNIIKFGTFHVGSFSGVECNIIIRRKRVSKTWRNSRRKCVYLTGNLYEKIYVKIQHQRKQEEIPPIFFLSLVFLLVATFALLCFAFQEFRHSQFLYY